MAIDIDLPASFVSQDRGGLVCTEREAKGPAPLWLLVHGWMCDRRFWFPFLSRLPPDHGAIACDLPGFGDSVAPAEPDEWTLDHLIRRVAGLAHDHGTPRLVLVGHSMGGPVIVEAARIAPQEVMGLVVVDALQDPDAPGLTLEAMQGFLARFEENFSDAMRDLVSTGMFVPESDPILKAWIVKDMASGPPQVGVGALRANILWPSTTRSNSLAALRVPVRLINSPLYPTDSAAVNRYGMDVVIMSGVGHFLMMENPKTFNALLSSAIADFAK